ncbi:EAL domain-containing protein [Erwinia aphidicola]
MERNLRRGIGGDELRLHYQPRYHLQSGRLEGAEALVRWQHQPGQLILPDSFIPLAEETGLIMDISDWVLNRACRDAASWPGELCVSVNISPKELRNGSLPLRVAAALEQSGLAAARLELEITENITMEHPESALEIMHQLKGLGVKIAVDDFGAGFASLGYLKKFPFDAMKMDRSYLDGYPHSRQAQSIVEGIIGLGRAFSLIVTAEGIETEEQLAQLRLIECQQGQGYLLGKPMALEALRGLMDKTVS